MFKDKELTKRLKCDFFFGLPKEQDGKPPTRREVQHQIRTANREKGMVWNVFGAAMGDNRKGRDFNNLHDALAFLMNVHAASDLPVSLYRTKRHKNGSSSGTVLSMENGRPVFYCSAQDNMLFSLRNFWRIYRKSSLGRKH